MCIGFPGGGDAEVEVVRSGSGFFVGSDTAAEFLSGLI